MGQRVRGRESRSSSEPVHSLSALFGAVSSGLTALARPNPARGLHAEAKFSRAKGRPVVPTAA